MTEMVNNEAMEVAVDKGIEAAKNVAMNATVKDYLVIGGVILGGALAGYGAYRLVKHFKGKKDKAEPVQASTAKIEKEVVEPEVVNEPKKENQEVKQN